MHKSTMHILLTLTILMKPAVCEGQIYVTATDVRQVKAKLSLATPYIAAIWKELFVTRNPTPPLPPIVAFRGGAASKCGQLGPKNAAFCRLDNTVYYDEVFLTELTKVAALSLHTDGDYAAVVALAHEVGHAVRFQQDLEACRPDRNKSTKGMSDILCSTTSLTVLPDWSYSREVQADCFAGAITKRLKEQNLLDPGDFQEGQFALGAVGDPIEKDPFFRRITHNHGEPVARQRHFEAGYRGGAAACQNPFNLIANDSDKTPPDPGWQNPFNNSAKPQNPFDKFPKR
jgi:predicted metalloprotease